MLAIRVGRRLQTGQALVELALVAPVLLFMAFGVLAVGRVAQVQMEVSAVADEAALAAAMASTATGAVAAGLERGQQVGNGYGLDVSATRITVDVSAFGRGGQVRVTVHSIVRLQDLPLLSWARVSVMSTQVAPVDTYRSAWPAGGMP